MIKRPARAESSRPVIVPAERLARWCVGFSDRHGAVVTHRDGPALVLSAEDRCTATLRPPFPLPEHVTDLSAFVAWAVEPRRCAVLLVRRGGYACAVVDAAEGVAASKIGSRYVQSRTAAGGWSQQRFARRRDNQARDLVNAVADVAARLLIPDPAQWLVTGGDRPLVDAVLADPRLRGLNARSRGPHLAVGDPRAETVRRLPGQLLAVRITMSPAPDSIVVDPPGG